MIFRQHTFKAESLTKFFDHFRVKVKAIRTAGSNADWQLSLPY